MTELATDVLIVEDDPFIALDLEETILRLGVKQARTATNVARALDLIDMRVPDLALLDVGLRHENSFEVAKRLAMLKVPFAFVTGYGSDNVPRDFADRPRLPKPCSTEELFLVLRRLGGAGEPA
jgi:DNA-binding response OmpR family regulator